MSTPDKDDDRLLRALALALVESPRASLQEIAKAAGISRATLYRFSPTRDGLIDRLLRHGTELLHGTLDTVDLEHGPVTDVLRGLITAQLEHRELMAFMIYHWSPDKPDQASWTDSWNRFQARMDSFFLRGQREGVFRIDISAAALTEAFGGLFCGLVEAEVRGRVARASLADVMETLFVRGAAA